jgi:hypothetical protein
MAIPFCTQADLEIAVGGAAVLRQLADPNRTGSPQPAIVTDYLEGGAAELRSATEVKHDPETLANLDADSLRRLRDANAAISARIAYAKGGLGQAMPDYIRESAERAEKFADQLAIGQRRLGRVAGGTGAPINQPATIVDYDPGGHAISITAFQKNGFR